MGMLASIFLDFNLPNATTWFYFALLLAIALFFKFTRVLSMPAAVASAISHIRQSGVCGVAMM